MHAFAKTREVHQAADIINTLWPILHPQYRLSRIDKVSQNAIVVTYRETWYCQLFEPVGPRLDLPAGLDEHMSRAVHDHFEIADSEAVNRL
jgi:hypothetical protein